VKRRCEQCGAVIRVNVDVDDEELREEIAEVASEDWEQDLIEELEDE